MFFINKRTRSQTTIKNYFTTIKETEQWDNGCRGHQNHHSWKGISTKKGLGQEKRIERIVSREANHTIPHTCFIEWILSNLCSLFIDALLFKSLFFALLATWLLLLSNSPTHVTIFPYLTTLSSKLKFE